MVPDNKYISERHRFWVDEIGRVGIWNPAVFSDITLSIRPKSKTCGGKFLRRSVVVGGTVRYLDRIFIYRNSPDMTEKDVDSVLVHEMLHQYIVQGGISDSSAHGHVFRTLADRINTTFAGRLNITVRGSRTFASGPGTKHYVLLVLKRGANVYCCVVCRTRVGWFRNYIARNYKAMKIDRLSWCLSNDMHFESFRQCRTSLHGEKVPAAEFDAYCRKYSLKHIGTDNIDDVFG